MSTPNSDDALAPRRRRSGPVRLSPDVVRSLEFPRTPLGRRGYCEAEVERFRVRVADTITRYDAEKAELREEVERLRAHFRRQAATPAAPAAPHPDGAEPAGADPAGADPAGNGARAHVARDGTPVPSVQAVNVLSRAQQAADAHVAQAQEYARRLVAEARARCDRIRTEAYEQAERAQQQAGQTIEEAARAHETTRAQLRSARDALTQELERLADPRVRPRVQPVVHADLAVHSGR